MVNYANYKKNLKGHYIIFGQEFLGILCYIIFNFKLTSSRRQYYIFSGPHAGLFSVKIREKF